MATKKSESTSSTALAVLKSQDLIPENISYEELKENLDQIDNPEFPRIRFRQGKFFFSDDPDDRGVEEFEGVIYYYGKQNTYWAGSYDPKNVTPPECFSGDGKTGSKPRNEDGEFGDCKSCKFNQFGSGAGKGKACRNQVKIYIQRMGTAVPMTLFLAPTSIGSFMQTYLMDKVTQKGLSYAKVVTKVRAYQKKDENFYRVGFDVVGVFKDEDAVQVKDLRDFWMPAIQHDRHRLEAMAEQYEDSDSESSSSSSSSGNTRVVKPREPAPVPDVIDEDDDVPF